MNAYLQKKKKAIARNGAGYFPASPPAGRRRFEFWIFGPESCLYILNRTYEACSSAPLRELSIQQDPECTLLIRIAIYSFEKDPPLVGPCGHFRLERPHLGSQPQARWPVVTRRLRHACGW